nr:patatin-like phospholipase family protein [Thalassobacillus sp. C254]
MVGAVEAMEEEGIKWQRLAGTSAGAVIAALLASGYKSWEMKEQMAELDYTQLQGRSLLNRVPL